MEFKFQIAAWWKRAFSSFPEEEDDDVAGSTKLAKSTQNPIFLWVFSILLPFQTGSHENVYGSIN